MKIKQRKNAFQTDIREANWPHCHIWPLQLTRIVLLECKSKNERLK